MAAGHVVLVTITLLCMFMGLGAVIAGAIGNAWYVNPVMTIGLWKTCIPACLKRTTLFDLKGDGLGTNIFDTRRLVNVKKMLF